MAEKGSDMNAMEAAWKKALDNRAQQPNPEKSAALRKRSEREAKEASRAVRDSLIVLLKAAMAASAAEIVYVDELSLTAEQSKLLERFSSRSRSSMRVYVTMSHLRRLMLMGV